LRELLMCLLHLEGVPAQALVQLGVQAVETNARLVQCG
jgi:hypothetical protein